MFKFVDRYSLPEGQRPVADWRISESGKDDGLRLVYHNDLGEFYRIKFLGGRASVVSLGTPAADLWDVDKNGELFVARIRHEKMAILHVWSVGVEIPVLMSSACTDFRVINGSFFYTMRKGMLSLEGTEEKERIHRYLGDFDDHEYYYRDILVGSEGDVALVYDNTMIKVDKTQRYTTPPAVSGWMSGPHPMFESTSGSLETSQDQKFSIIDGDTRIDLGLFQSNQHCFHISGRVYFQMGTELYTLRVGSTSPEKIWEGHIYDFKVCHTKNVGTVVVRERGGNFCLLQES